MQTLILPDIHTKFGIAESIIEKENADEVVFLGDYFDSYDNYETAHQTAVWLKESMKKAHRTHLMGNHDLSYARTEWKFKCSGYEVEKDNAIKPVGIKWSELQHYVWVDDWLLTHAGLTKGFYDQFRKDGEDVNQFLLRMCEDNDLRDTLYSVSAFRGGHDEYAGILWCDWREMDTIPGVKQMFGHTVGDIVRHRDNKTNYCIDTGLNHYAIYDHEKSKMSIKKVSETLHDKWNLGEI
jgi:hypothetical protein